MKKRINIIGLVLCAVMLAQMIPASAMKIGEVPDGWYFQAINGSVGTARVTDEKAHTGKNSMLITSDTEYAANRFLNIFVNNLQVEEGKTYKFGCWAKGTNVNGSALAVDWGSRVSLQPFSNYDWQEISGTWTSNKNGTAEFQILVESFIKKLYIDDVFMYEIDEQGNKIGDNLFSKTSFEEDDSDVVVRTAGMNEKEKLLYSIQTNGGGTVEDFNAICSILDSVPVFNHMSEDVAIPEDTTQKDNYGGKDDCSANVRFSYDGDKFYLEADVTDDVFSDEPDSATRDLIAAQQMIIGAAGIYNEKMYYVDSIQFALSDGENTYELGVRNANDSSIVKCYTNNLSDEQLGKIEADVTKKKKGLSYKVAVPWEIISDSLPDSVLFDIRVNDSDNKAKVQNFQWGGAMSDTIDVNKLKKLTFINNNEFYQVIEDNSAEHEATKPLNFDYYLVNAMAAKKEFTVTFPDNTQKKIEVPGGSVYYEAVSVTYDAAGDYELKFSAEDAAGQKYENIFNTNVGNTIIVLNEFKERTERLKNEKLPELKKLRDELNERGISTDYEDVTINVLERHIGHELDDIEQKLVERSQYNVSALEKMAQNAYDSLKAYDDGSKTPLLIPKFKTSLVTHQGKSSFAQTEDGQIRPVYFVGYGHFDQATSDIPNFNGFGANIIQRELPLQDTVRISDDGSFYIDPAYITLFDEFLTNADKYNVKFDLLLPQHYIRYMSGISRFENSESINNPIRKEILAKFYEAVLPMAIKHKSLISFCISNEPWYRLENNEYDLEYFRKYLSEIYDGDISRLNENYRKEYNDFSEITIPEDWYSNGQWSLCEDPANWAPGDLNMYTDWMDASCKSFAEYHQWMADEIRKYAPDVPLHAKVQSPFKAEDEEWGRHYMSTGINYEIFADIVDINGNDACNFIHRNEEILDKLMWYDYQTSIKNAPVFNSEDHITLDGATKDYDDTYAPHFYTDMWQGAIHGRTMSTIWLWQRSYWDNVVMGNILERPDCVDAVGRASLDLNRLSYEINALANVKPEVAVYYTYSARIRDSYLLNALHMAYTSNSYLGERTSYVNDDQIKKYALDDYKVVIIPEIDNMTNDILAHFVEYAENGGTVVIMGKESLRHQKYDNPTDENLRNRLFEKAIVVDSKRSEENDYQLTYPHEEDMQEILYDIYNSKGMLNVKVIDNETGKPAYGIEVNETVYEGKQIINLCNYIDYTEKNVSIEVNGKKISKGINRLTEEEIDCANISLKTNEPVLISVEE